MAAAKGPRARVALPPPEGVQKAATWSGWLAGWCTMPVFVFGTVMVVVAALLFDLYGPAPPIVVSPRTTVITGPLAEDGLPDYPRYLLEAYGPAPPPDDNAAVPLFSAVWPMGMSDTDARLVCKAIGTVPQPLATSLGRVSRNRYLGSDAGMLPWRGEDALSLRDWLIAHREAIEVVVGATERPTLWLPPPSLLRGEAWTAIGAQAHHLPLRTAADVLALDAMRLGGEGAFDEAWRRTRAIHRLARLIATGDRMPGGIIDLFAPWFIALTANDCTLALLSREALPDTTLAAIRRDLAALPPLPGLAAALAWDRLSLAAVITASSREGPQSMTLAMDMLGEGPQSYFVGAGFDRNMLLEMMNGVYDRLDEAARRPAHADRMAGMRTVAGSLVTGWESRLPPRDLRDLECLAGLALMGRSRRDRIVSRMICIDLSSLWESDETLGSEAACGFDLAIVAAALEAARRADPARAYPERLDGLAEFLPLGVPDDRFTGKPLLYERRGEGYLLESLGPDMDDDGGTARQSWEGWIIRGEWQPERAERSLSYPDGDIVVRMPMAATPFPKR